MVALAAPLLASSAHAQSWRHTAEGLGTSSRVLIIGTRPEDEDNALIAWLSLGHHIEVAYLSLTRGESGVNRIGSEQSWSLGVVRTAELLEERKRDGAHQYFTRAFDFGSTTSDSLVNARWPHDSLLEDVVSVVRAFRPHAIVSVFADSDRDATHRVVAKLAREVYSAAQWAPRSWSSNLPPWTASRLLTVVDSMPSGSAYEQTDIGELDAGTTKSYAELGAEIRRLQRSQPASRAPPSGHLWRVLRVDSTDTATAGPGLFGRADTSLNRFSKGSINGKAQALLDSLRPIVSAVRASAMSASRDSIAVGLARIAHFASQARTALGCVSIGTVPACNQFIGDLAEALDWIQARATRGVFEAAGIALDATADRERVATGDSAGLTLVLRNGSRFPVSISRARANTLTFLARPTPVLDSATVVPDSVGRWATRLRMDSQVGHWWQAYGLVEGTALESVSAPTTMSEGGPVAMNRSLIAGEDRLPATSVQASLSLAGISSTDFPVTVSPIVYRSDVALRGDDRHPLSGVKPLAVLLDVGARYERAGLPITHLLPVTLQSVRAKAETVMVDIETPKGLKADSASRMTLLPPYSTRTVYFGLKGKLAAAVDTIHVTAQFGAPIRAAAHSPPQEFQAAVYDFGILARDYEHIPSQYFFHSAIQRLEVVDLKVPPKLRVAYITSSTNDEVDAALSELKIETLPLQPALFAVADLTPFTTVLIAPYATADASFAVAAPALRNFMLRGGTVVALRQGPPLIESGALPWPMAFDSLPTRVSDPASRVTLDAKSPLLSWPNAITARDFAGWSGMRATDVPASFDSHYQPVLVTGDAGQSPTPATLLVAPVGKGTFIYSALSLDRQLVAIHGGAARLLANLLSAGLERRAAADDAAKR